MDDEILSITGRPVPRIGPTASEQHWLWNAVGAVVCPLVFLPRHISQHDWIAVAMWLFVLAAGLARSQRRAEPPGALVALLMISLATAAGVLVLAVKDPMWRAIGLAIAPIPLLIDAFAKKRNA
jgi:hypothetical protein